MTGLNHNLITQRFKLNNKVALITGAHPWLFAVSLWLCTGHYCFAALLPSLQSCRVSIQIRSLPDTTGLLCKTQYADAMPTLACDPCISNMLTELYMIGV